MKRYSRAAVKRISEELDYDRYSFAIDPETSSRILDQLADDTDWTIRSNVAKHPNVSAETLTKLAGDPIYNVRTAVAENPNAPTRALLKLVSITDHQSPLLYAIHHPNVTSEVLHALVDCPHFDVRAEIAVSPKTSRDDLAHLAYDRIGEVRGRVAYNPNTPVEALEHLVTDTTEVRYHLAGNKNAPIEILSTLLDDPVNYIRKRAAENVAKRQGN